MPLLTLIPVSFALLPQTFMSWSGGGGGLQAGKGTAALITLLLMLSLGMLVRIAWSGMVFDVRAANPPKAGEGQAPVNGNRAAQANAGKRA